ncbi:hypothetical protein SLEP1_g42314 [Rubroshorea leprosula]|uniref:Secreted peptide n=1 Tax=Rubroshorea leprosula TaxID=152421 RepID=A0AAV5LAB0_9ROSI|nr:hypothetical protein SLEP1_g42314 [Rubroshorea leprosula]
MHDRTTSRVVLPLYCVPSLVIAIPTAMAQQVSLTTLLSCCICLWKRYTFQVIDNERIRTLSRLS